MTTTPLLVGTLLLTLAGLAAAAEASRFLPRRRPAYLAVLTAAVFVVAACVTLAHAHYAGTGRYVPTVGGRS